MSMSEFYNKTKELRDGILKSEREIYDARREIKKLRESSTDKQEVHRLLAYLRMTSLTQAQREVLDEAMRALTKV